MLPHLPVLLVLAVAVLAFIRFRSTIGLNVVWPKAGFSERSEKSDACCELEANNGSQGNTMFFKSYAELTKDEIYALLQLRAEVFVVEQDSVYQDLDWHDQKSIHLMHWEGEKLVAYGRICPAGTAHDALSFGRLVTAKHVRGTGLGKALVDALLAYIDEHYPNEPIIIEAQGHLAKWYEGYGFEMVGEPYDWGGIMHVPMRRAANT